MARSASILNSELMRLTLTLRSGLVSAHAAPDGDVPDDDPAGRSVEAGAPIPRTRRAERHVAFDGSWLIEPLVSDSNWGQQRAPALTAWITGDDGCRKLNCLVRVHDRAVMSQRVRERLDDLRR